MIFQLWQSRALKWSPIESWRHCLGIASACWLVPPCSSHFVWLWFLVPSWFSHGSQILAGWGSVSPHFVVSHLASWRQIHGKDVSQNRFKDLPFPYVFLPNTSNTMISCQCSLQRIHWMSTKNHLIVPEMVEGYEKLYVYIYIVYIYI